MSYYSALLSALQQSPAVPPDPAAPVITGSPTIAGEVAVGETLTASPASRTGYPTPVTTWQWTRDGVDISGATAATYALVRADVGVLIRARQIETNSEGTANATSDPAARMAYGDDFAADSSGEWALGQEAVDGTKAVADGSLVYTKGAGDGVRPRIVVEIAVTTSTLYRVKVPAATGTANRKETWVSTASNGDFEAAITSVVNNTALDETFTPSVTPVYLVMRAGTDSATGETVAIASAVVREEEEVSSNVTFEDTFATLSISDSGNGVNWAGYFYGYNARQLSSNGDMAIKGGPDYRGTGGQTLEELGLSCHEVSNGTLKLYGRQIPPEHQGQFYSQPYVGGMITNEHNFSQLYGVFDVRAKLFADFGHHWAIWLLPKSGAWPPEIDMVERLRSANGYSDSRLFMNTHAPAGTVVSRSYHNGAVGAFGVGELDVGSYAAANDWHTYRFVWTPDIMEWYIDGVLRMSCANYINVPMYFLISPEIGGNWPGPTNQNTQWPMVGEIDYVRIYDLSEIGLDQVLYPNGVL